MYVLRNALKCISRSIGRNILIGIIVLVISVSACIGLFIRQAAENAKTDTLADLSITATISFDRSSAMKEMRDQMSADGENQQGNEPPSFDRSQFKDMMNESSSLTLEEYQTYAEADSVQDFYYTLSASLNGSDDFEPVSNTTENTDEDNTTETTGSSENYGNMTAPDGMGGNMPGGMGGGMERMMGAQSDFSITGYSSEDAMTSFIEGTATIEEGAVFEENTTKQVCIISSELATYNDLSVGDKITLTNPNNEDETYKFKIVGIYSDSSANESSFSMMGATSTDPANQIYTSYEALQAIIDKSAETSETTTDENTGMEFETGLAGTLTGTYVFANTEDYYTFEEEVAEMGLDDSYAVSSSDITAFENSLAPLETLSTTAGYFLIVILLIGAILLIVLNIFYIRERKYEIGVLTAIGMKKGKVALQFLAEIMVVTLVAVIISIGIGAVTSVPVTNALLESRTSARTAQAEQVEMNFGRGGDMGGKGDMQTPPDANMGGMQQFMSDTSDYITEINSTIDIVVILQMLGIALLLTLVASTVSILFIMRYEPLKILANRD